ncbi:Organic radical activating enzyme (plasmid) [Legionella adelaidensis]|uniref:7-carboxy-7-deazaguanine synthase n=1 Tax=Legionella adelaidensis TaxID=45056 RepID=A0A0W0R077_9GAMM|nr:7-carboxy-7-deazaguanine synthase QueE [Legionella adelaidensis]KTC64483.1 radical activating enzyme [Legionella adelaidensis]VEH85851.1 Organic radical activating enzyme [Legionella adelaidensis]
MKSFQNRLRITEIFHSIQGESNTVGWPTVFVRLTGCPLRCQYCDTAYAFSGGEMYSLESILEKVKSFHCPYVCITGGEPLAQPACITLLTMLCDAGCKVSLETSGARDISQVDPRVMIVMDIKTPDSLECEKNMWTNLAYLKSSDQIKFVICSQQDYEWAKQIIIEKNLAEKCDLLFSPSWEQINPTDLANWIVNDRLPVRFQLQLHKILWNDTPGH